MKNIILTYLLVAILPILGIAQYSFDECDFAQELSYQGNYCSEEAGFNTNTATPSSLATPACWQQGVFNDVWFSFVPRNLGVSIQISGKTSSSINTLTDVSVAVYEGNCNQLTLFNQNCSSDYQGFNIIELTDDTYNIGQRYYIRVAGRDAAKGSFKLCINEFSPIPSPEADCNKAVLLCDKSPIVVENINTIGDVNDDLSGSCLDNEKASVWYKWICKDPGDLTFVIDPINPVDDIDFILYRLPNGIDNCDGREIIRCMASGETGGQSANQNKPCTGATGLMAGDSDVTESRGCQSGDNNFLAPYPMVTGEAYALIINNYSKSGNGYNMSWGGSGTFLGPEVDFEIVADQNDYECDKQITFVNKSTTLTDSIVSYQWSFGFGSQPNAANTFGSHTVIYDGFGDKVGALTAITKRGCIVTKTHDFYIEPCCSDNNTLNGSESHENISCYNFKDGTILLDGQGGNPTYLYALDNGSMQSSPYFGNLAVGQYTGYVIDKKGCRDSLTINLTSPEEFVVIAEKDTTMILGDKIQLDGRFFPYDMRSLQWYAPDSTISDTQIINPEAMPLRDVQYVLSVTDENGCTSHDTINIRVQALRDVYAPNAFSPDGNRNNDFFNIFSTKSADSILSLKIYDRWGGLMFTGAPKLNDPTQGWDGTKNGKPVKKGVYAWVAKLRYLDGVVEVYHGDITVVR